MSFLVLRLNKISW